MSKIINITKSAEEYLAKLVNEKDDNSIGIRIFISDPGTPKAETCLAYCKAEEANPKDELIKLETLDAFIDQRSIPFLKDAEVNFDHDNFGGQLTIKAPNARFPNISEDSPVEDRINYVIYNEINPMLESHGGEVSLVKFTEEKQAVLQFGGGCQGCGMVDVTLKDGIEKTLIEQIPELQSVIDITDHSDGENAYYKT
ncbi:Fe-S biogenesis protein NfuA [Gammaproteobacteria bacterium]|jgi:Fe/S biogenesis protein NfuA|nr:Fe-S biogenesis protein NfuA [Gammaproteobacteria bacterium]MDA9112926.1 Fe-S biogenesis protein NfuA [Gammaproteobacteria bacterium]MDB9861630.1 Fe-S biogenesis protein NfuA [Gammaproteobacteria bacterium]MDB9997381.1 Fe-S biogenesis protein NfuA [Gammaproteobacteria bacterium]MDC1190827.1 Fe-S biogenesis protein NfuA [Gammaproteobacteria bacterium]|tara:strand:+ start:1820 stop:2413 length:594 start_codon:yes stop_codon:yes gene_type:complete